jgi:SH3-like domain-containing protein
MKPRVVLENHTASYADPIEVTKGAPISLTGREDTWDGHRWLWAVADDGREGWVPDDLVSETDDGPVAARDFAAIELTCSAGEAVAFIRETHGWAWCRKDDGREGWLPLRNLSAR